MVLLVRDHLRIREGNVLESDAEALVNTVNTVGVMGKGIALQFKKRFPANYDAYKKACESGELQVGKMFVWATGRLTPRFIINFPTKKHWRGNSKMEYIEQGLRDLRRVIQKHGIKSIAVPPLGCGHGGLEWGQVRPKIEQALADLPGVQVQLYAPLSTTPPPALDVRSDPPRLTRMGAQMVTAMSLYQRPGYTLGRLEIQKLGYLLQSANAPDFRFQFKQHRYGPYAEGLTHAVERMEGHFIKGFGDRSKASTLEPTLEGLHLAKKQVRGDPEAKKAMEAFQDVIRGYETPYGLELLASVHWALHHPIKGVPADLDLVEKVHAWSKRKKAMFPPSHIEQARERVARLEEQAEATL
jgi:O-acetyl-ADP-ribose deacetylase (regulator of RNase III)